MKSLLRPYRVMANLIGVLLIVLILIGVPLANFDGSAMWGVFPATPSLVTPGSSANQAGDWITSYLGVAHGWLYMGFLVVAFMLSRRARWDLGFTAVTLLAGTVPILSFWAEHRATADVRRRIAAESSPQAEPTTGRATGPTTGRTAERDAGQAGAGSSAEPTQG